ncbi:MAG: MFS transporter [Candidatus Sumerlaeia bacterium]
MSDRETYRPLKRHELRKVWQLITVAGMMGITYQAFCILEVPRVRFLTELGATPLDFGVIAALASVTLAFQILGGAWSARLTHRKIPWMIITILHRLLFILVLAAPLLALGERGRIWWIIIALFFHDALMHLGMPMWLAWMGDLVPDESLNKLWGQRQKSVTAANIVTAFIAAVVMGYFEKQGQVIVGFTLLASAGIIAGVLDILLFIKVPEPPQEEKDFEPMFRAMMRPLRDKHYRPFVYFMLYWYFVMMMIAPFFTLYMIDSMKLSSFYVQCITVCMLIGLMISSGAWGRICDIYGNRPVLQIALILKPFTVLAFVLVPSTPGIAIPALAITYFFDGILNAALILSVQGIMFHASPKKNRAMYIATINFLALGLAGGISPLIAGAIINHYPDLSIPFITRDFNIYNIVFFVCILMRAAALIFAARVPSRRMTPVTTVFKHIFDVRLFRILRTIRLLENSPKKRDRIRAARILGRLHSPLALGALIDALQDPSRQVRRASIHALGKIGNDEAAAHLELAIQERNPRLQSPAVRALAKIGSLKSFQTLLDNLEELDDTALMWTIGYLGQTGDNEAIYPLLRLYERVEDPEIRKKIQDALSRINDSDSPQEVVAMFDSARRPGLQP